MFYENNSVNNYGSLPLEWQKKKKKRIGHPNQYQFSSKFDS